MEKKHTLIGRTVQGQQIFIPSNIVSDGLLLHLDANNISSYSGSGDTWFDLASPSNDITLIGSPTFDSNSPKHFSFNGSNQYGTGSGETVPANAYTKCVWFKLNSYATNNNLVSSTDGHFMFFGATNKLHCGHTDWPNYGLNFLSYPSNATFNLSTWYFAILTFDITNGMTLYINGALDSTFSQNTPHPGSPGSTDIASFGGDNLLNGSISIVLTYNRAISQSEALANYNATKNIFGY